MNYTPLRITTLKPEREIPFGLFIFFKDQYLQYINSGEEIQKEKYKKLRKQKITKFFINSTDEPKYQSFLDNLLTATLDDDNVSIEEKAEIVTGQAETAIERLHENPTDEASFDMARKASQNIRKIVFDDPKALNQIFGEHGENDKIIQHSINVCALSIKLATVMKIEDSEIDYLATAALMHDVGVTQLPEETQLLFDKPKSDYDASEKLAYAAHCKDFIKVLAGKDYINGRIITLIEHHEETKTGEGPNKKAKLDLCEEILSLVNTYDKKIIIEKKGPEETVKNMMIDEVGKYDLSLIKKFQEVLKSENLA